MFNKNLEEIKKQSSISNTIAEINKTTDKESISKIYKQLTKLNTRKNKQSNQKLGQRTEQTVLQRRRADG